MSIEYSRAFRNFIQGYGSKRQALEGGVIDIWDGSGVVPTSPDDAATGVKLVRCTLDSGDWTPEVLSMGSVTLDSGASGSVNTVKVDSIDILDAAISFDTSLAVTATAVALAINNSSHTRERYFAYAVGAVIYIRAVPGSGVTPSGFTVASTVTTIGKTDANMDAEATGVAAVNGITYNGPVNGVFARDGVISGLVLATGYAAYFRIIGSVADAGGADAAPWNQIRVQGTCGTSGADYNMDTTYLLLDATHTLDTWTETLDE